MVMGESTVDVDRILRRDTQNPENSAVRTKNSATFIHGRQRRAIVLPIKTSEVHMLSLQIIFTGAMSLGTQMRQ
jgi:hypothetical protein